MLLVLVIVYCVSTMIAQEAMQDVLYLKNGNVIRGTIIEFVPDKIVKIQTDDGSLFVFAVTEVEKIQKEKGTVPAKSAPVSKRSPTGNDISVGLCVGATIPIGDFAERQSNLGGADGGFGVGLQLVSTKQVGVLLNLSYSSNSSKIVDSWSCFFALVGLKVSLLDSTKPDLYIAPTVGFLYARIPDIGLTGSGSAFAYGGIIGLRLKEYLGFGMRIAGGTPDLKIGYYGTADQAISMIHVFLALNI